MVPPSISSRMSYATMHLKTVQGTVSPIALLADKLVSFVQVYISYVLLEIIRTAAVFPTVCAVQFILVSFTCNTIKRDE